MASLEPFDPKKHKPIDTVAGNKATEYTTTMESPDGKIWNIPQIWFDEKTKEPKYLAGDKAWDAAEKYEERTKKKFPRFDSLEEGDTAAQERSNAGGATDKPLAYSKGGITMNTDNQMKLYALGGMEDDGMEVDPVSGNEIPPGSMAREVRDDIPAQLSDGEYVVPADVVRFFGVKYFEDLRQEAKMGLQSMESDGRIGGEPVEMGKGLTEGDLAALEEMTRTGVASGGLMDKLAYTAMNDPMVNQRLNAGGLPVKFAVGGLAQSQYSNPNQVDQIINRITSAVQQKPELMQQLASRGISVNRTEANVPAQDLQKDNSPSQTTNPIMAAAGTYVSPSNVGFQAPMYVPPEFGTLGGSYFTPQQYGLPPTPVAPVAPVAEVPITCPPGFILDTQTKSCIPDPNIKRDDGGNDNNNYGQDTEVNKYTKPEQDFFSMSEKDLAKVGEEGLGGVGKGIKAGSFLLGGGPGLALTGIANSAMQGQSIANVRAAALTAEARGLTDLAGTLNKRADTMLGQASNVVQGLAKLGQITGINRFADQVRFNAPLGQAIEIKNLTQRQDRILKNSVAPEGMKYVPEEAAYVREGSAADDKGDKVETVVRDKVSVDVYTPNKTTVKPKPRPTNNNNDNDNSDRDRAMNDARSGTGGFADKQAGRTTTGYGGGRAKGGLMVRKK